MGLPARLFLEMEGVFISSRFLRENIAARGWGGGTRGCLAASPAATPPAAFAGANCQDGACDAALFPHRLCRRT